MYTRLCTTETPCDISYCDIFEDNICKVTIPCEASLCSSLEKSSHVTGDFQLTETEILSKQDFCDFMFEFKSLYCVGAIKCALTVGEFSSEYTAC